MWEHKRNLEQNEQRKDSETPGRIRNEWKYLREFDTIEQRDHELIREYLNDAPVRFGEQELKVENE